MTNNPLKLFVVGEASPNPDDWSIWSEWSLVMASSVEEAIQLDGKRRQATEIPMDKPMVLVSMDEPNWGDDL